MPYQDTVFGGLMKAFPRWRFDKLAERHGADYRVRRLSSWSQFQAMVFAQLSGSRSLREAVGALERFPGVHAHLGLPPVRRSTLADANRVRPAALFEDVLEALIAQLGASASRHGREMLRLIDATRVLVLLPGLFDDGFLGLFREIGARISRTDRSLLPEGRDVAAVANGRWRIAAMA